MALIGAYRGWNIEPEMLIQWQEGSDLFPVIPIQSCFNRCQRNLMQAFNWICLAVLRILDLAYGG
jgi:hypothetical protein